MTPEQQLHEALKIQHSDWLNHPVTKLMFQAFSANKNSFVNIVSRESNSVSFTDQQIRHHCISIRRIDDIVAIASDFELLMKKLKS